MNPLTTVAWSMTVRGRHGRVWFMLCLNRTDRSLLEKLAAVAQSETGLLVSGVPERWRLRSAIRH